MRKWNREENLQRSVLGDCSGKKKDTALRLAISTAKHRPFRVKFQGNTLLNMRNIRTVLDFVFNDWIVKSVVGGFNPKTLIKCYFLEQNYRFCC